ncbi:MAG: cation transporter, partial [Betaproteobacteria bacterium]
MAHFRRQLAGAAALNGAIFVVEAVAGYGANSLSLLMDAVHNLSDQAALVLLYLALLLSSGVSRALVRSANLFNSVGLMAVSALLLWQAAERVLAPMPVMGAVPAIVGLAAAVGNWGVARLLREPARGNPAVRLAYLHNLGDMWVSLAPVVAGILVT